MRPADYIWIRLYGELEGSYPYYIREKQERAAAENAPRDAWSKDHETGRWNRFSELPLDNALRGRLERYRCAKGLDSFCLDAAPGGEK